MGYRESQLGNRMGKIIYSHEKKFNIDGPGDWCRYQGDLRKGEKTFCKGNTGDGGVMVWDALSKSGQIGFTPCFLKMNQDKCTKALEKTMLEYYIMACI